MSLILFCVRLVSAEDKDLLVPRNASTVTFGEPVFDTREAAERYCDLLNKTPSTPRHKVSIITMQVDG